MYDAEHTYADLIHFVHVYVIEPHPGPPDHNPYRGEVSGLTGAPNQPRTYADRVALARQTNTLLKGNQLMLVDDLMPLARTNPMWCTYGPGPNCGFLIDQSGKFVQVHDWLKMDFMRIAIDELLSE